MNPPPLFPILFPHILKVLAVSSSETAVKNDQGLDIPQLRHHLLTPGSLLAEFGGGTGEWRYRFGGMCGSSSLD